MNLALAHRLACSLMAQHGVDHWNFKFDRAVKRFGLCDYRTRTLSLSKYLTELNTEEEVRDTILHEIAHALAGYAAGHGPAWRAVHTRLGGNGKRLHKAVTPELRYRAVCPSCQHVFKRSRASRYMNGHTACTLCCKSKAGGQFDRRFLLTWVDTTSVSV